MLHALLLLACCCCLPAAAACLTLALQVVEPFFEDIVIDQQCLLDSPATWGKVLDLVPDANQKVTCDAAAAVAAASAPCV